MIALWLLLAAPVEGRPLFYWGARPPVIVPDAIPPSAEAPIVEVHAAVKGGDLVVRFTFDEPVRGKLYLQDGTPVSGRVRAVLYIDADNDRKTGLDFGSQDLRTGADLRLEVGVLSLGGDPAEKIQPKAVVTATLASLAPDGRRRTLWRADDTSSPDYVSVHGEWLEVRLPEQFARPRPAARLILSVGDRSWDGRLESF